MLPYVFACVYACVLNWGCWQIRCNPQEWKPKMMCIKPYAYDRYLPTEGMASVHSVCLTRSLWITEDGVKEGQRWGRGIHEMPRFKTT